jgi:hypothetical protein
VPDKESSSDLTESFREALSRATSSWRDHHNAGIRAHRQGQGTDRAQFMEDIGKGWIVPEDFNPDAAEVGWGVAVGDPKYRKALGMSADREELADPTSRSTVDMRHGFQTDRARAGRYMGRGSLGTPVYVDPGRYGGSYTTTTDKAGKMGVFAPGGKYVTTGGPSTGTLGHELGHAKQTELLNDPYVSERDREPGRKYFRKIRGWPGDDTYTAASEAVAGYLGRRIIRSKEGWGAAADDKSWGAYSGLPSYLRGLEGEDLGRFLGVMREYEKQYPGIYNETVRAIKEYDTLVAPKSINDTSRGDWSEEGLEFMKEWRKKKGLKEVPEGDLQDRADQMGPYAMRKGLRGKEIGQAVAGLGRGDEGVVSPDLMSRYLGRG